MTELPRFSRLHLPVALMIFLASAAWAAPETPHSQGFALEITGAETGVLYVPLQRSGPIAAALPLKTGEFSVLRVVPLVTGERIALHISALFRDDERPAFVAPQLSFGGEPSAAVRFGSCDGREDLLRDVGVYSLPPAGESLRLTELAGFEIEPIEIRVVRVRIETPGGLITAAPSGYCSCPCPTDGFCDPSCGTLDEDCVDLCVQVTDCQSDADCFGGICQTGGPLQGICQC